MAGRCTRLTVRPASFDLVLDCGTAYHIAQPELALAEVARVLRPGGLLIHETPLSQLLAHPIRAGLWLPWATTAKLRHNRWRGLWASRIRHES
jgi:ubiquinone/menaquinone biosynthesis C-methylase UbiE